ncbi:hypothetical protein G5V59_07840 [Nocardioides sp. W3-2-3]|uniref:hypothetical protein n=1 Tax=Nocardioides convexus TaxID=2712224 RepID=UPI0024183B25|nr:hypothetical protein [Nocardioides convexus]NHA00106.1 hypothetical protein [Nocardioides convexus]
MLYRLDDADDESTGTFGVIFVTGTENVPPQTDHRRGEGPRRGHRRPARGLRPAGPRRDPGRPGGADRARLAADGGQRRGQPGQG